MIEPEFRELFSEQVTLFPQASKDKYGKRTFASAGVVVPAHLVAETMLTRDENGNEVVQTGKAYLYGDYSASVSTNHKILLDDGSSPVIIGVDTPYDQNGPHHTVVRFGR